MTRPFQLYTSAPVRIEIKYGKKHPQKGYPMKIDHFLVVDRAKKDGTDFRKSNWVVCEDVHEELGEKQPTRVPIVLMSDEIEENFALSRAFFFKGSLMCSAAYGDKMALRRYEKQNGALVDKEPYEHPCNSDCSVWSQGKIEVGKSVLGGCDISGNLYFHLAPDLPRSNDFGICRMKGTNAQRRMMSSLMILKARAGGILANLPLELCMHWEKMQDKNGRYNDIPLISVQPRTGTNFEVEVMKELRRRRELADLLGETKLKSYSGVLGAVTGRDAFDAIAEDVDEVKADVEMDTSRPDHYKAPAFLDGLTPIQKEELIAKLKSGEITEEEARERAESSKDPLGL